MLETNLKLIRGTATSDQREGVLAVLRTLFFEAIKSDFEMTCSMWWGCTKLRGSGSHSGCV